LRDGPFRFAEVIPGALAPLIVWQTERVIARSPQGDEAISKTVGRDCFAEFALSTAHVFAMTVGPSFVAVAVA
jgi:hypothetical protein